MESGNKYPAKSPRIIFMGTPEFAVASLDALVKAHYNVVAVITAPDKPAGRGMQLQQSAVKKYAIEKGIPVLQPEKLKNPDFLSTLKSFKANLQVVVAFRMLPEVVWDMPPLGTINVHGSLLPHYRGAAPINWAVINGEATTGVTTFKLQHQIDTGDILLQDTLSIGPNETAGELHDRMKEAGAGLLVKTVTGLIDNSLKPQPQATIDADMELKHAPKIFTETCRVNTDNTAKQVHNLIRGLSPFPGAFTSIYGKTVKLFRSHIYENDDLPLQPGKWVTDLKTKLLLGCADGFVAMEEIQMEGKKRMPVADFLRGFKTMEGGDVMVSTLHLS